MFEVTDEDLNKFNEIVKPNKVDYKNNYLYYEDLLTYLYYQQKKYNRLVNPTIDELDQELVEEYENNKNIYNPVNYSLPLFHSKFFVYLKVLSRYSPDNNQKNINRLQEIEQQIQYYEKLMNNYNKIKKIQVTKKR